MVATSAVPLTWRLVTLAAEALLDAVAALVEADVALLVDDAQDLLGALLLEARARACAGDRLVLADVGDRAERLELVARPS